MEFWSNDQLEVTIDGPAGPSITRLPQPFVRVGSHPQADVVINDDSVAPRCLYLHAVGGSVFCLYLDLDSPKTVGRGTWLLCNQAIEIGQHRLTARVLAAEQPAAAPRENLAAWGSAPPPVPLMMIYCGQRLKDKRRFRARLSAIGRRPQCSLQLKGEQVSGFHCALYWQDDELWCIDLNSGNGTQLAGESIVCSRVNIGDRVDVGEFGLVFQRVSHRPLAPSSTATSPLQPLAVPAAEPLSQDLPGETVIGATPSAASEASESPTERNRNSEEVRLREQLAAEVAGLAREREDMHRQWHESSQQLLAQINRLQDDAARLTQEREALEQARRQWQVERAALAEQLAQRGEQLTRLESELSAATSSLAAKISQLDERTVQPIAAVDPHEPSPAELERQAQERELREQLAAEVAALTRERQELKAHWSQTSAQLVDQISQLQAEAARLAAQRQALETSRQEQPATEAAAIEAAIGASETPLQFTSNETADLASQEAPVSPATPASASQDQEAIIELPTAEPAQLPIGPYTPADAFGPRPSATVRDQLPQLVSDRLLDLDRGHRRRRLLWWSAGGLGLITAIAVIVLIVIWAF